MTLLREAVGSFHGAARALEWRQDGWASRRSTLREGDHELARFRTEGWLGAAAVMDFGNTSVRFRRKDFWGRREVVWQGSADRPGRSIELEFDPGLWGRGTVRSRGGRDLELGWRQVRFWRPAYAWRRGDDSLIRFERRGAFFRSGFDILIEREAETWPELPGLLGLGWWLLLESRRRAAH